MGGDSLIELDSVTKLHDIQGLVYEPLKIINLERGASTEKAALPARFEIEESLPTATVDYYLKLLTADSQTAQQKNNLTLDYRSLLSLNLNRTSGSVWGTDIYTDDSPLAAVAVHQSPKG